MNGRSIFLACLACAVAGRAVAAAETAPANERRPNVIFILLDDQGWADAGSLGHPYM